MDLKTLRDEVSLIVQDASFDAPTLNMRINEAVRLAASLVDMPSLKRIGSAQTVVGQNYVSLTSMTGGFSGRLRKIVSPDDVAIYASLEAMAADYGEDNWDAAGDVTGLVLEGNNLWYQAIPDAASSITFVYFKTPELLVNDDDSPDDFPEELHRKLFIHGTAYVIYDLIEDEDEGEKAKPNTMNQFYHSFNEDAKHSGITMLREYIARRRIHHISSRWDI